MKIELSKEETEEIFYNALCNAEGTGYMEGYGIELKVDRSQYKAAAEMLAETNRYRQFCYEDVLMHILRLGGSLTFVDREGRGEMNSTITLEDVHSRVNTAPAETLLNYANHCDDVSDADEILQTVFWKERIFA